MVVAPELFDEHRALYALQLADRVLRGPLGMKTLDPSDMYYRPIHDPNIDPWVGEGLSRHNVGIFQIPYIVSLIPSRDLSGDGY